MIKARHVHSTYMHPKQHTSNRHQMKLDPRFRLSVFISLRILPIRYCWYISVFYRTCAYFGLSQWGKTFVLLSDSLLFIFDVYHMRGKQKGSRKFAMDNKISYDFPLGYLTVRIRSIECGWQEIGIIRM